MTLLQSGIAKPSSGYDIDQSLRFDDGDSPILSRTPSSASNQKTWTWSGWVKRSNLSAYTNFFDAHTDNNNRFYLAFNASDKLEIYGTNSASNVLVLTTTAVYRDCSAFYHIAFQCDTTQASSSDRAKLYVNGEQVTAFDTATYPAQDTDLHVNSTAVHRISSYAGTSNYLDGYLAEVNFIDGQALTPASFGETNSATNQWVPIEYTGSYGTNGFYLKFQDSSALGDDSSGNTNDFTPTNLAATDQVLDSPTLNYCTLNPLDQRGTLTLSEGNLTVTSSSSDPEVRATIEIPQSGKWYWEFLMQYSTSFMIGVVDQTVSGNPYGSNQSVLYSSGLGTKYNFSSVASYGATWTTGDLMGIAFNRDDNEITFYKNNSAQPTLTIGGTAAQRARLVPVFATGTSGTGGGTVNFGQDSSFAGAKTAQGNTDGNGIGDFYYTPPSGYLALCTDNLPDPSIADPTKHFNTVLYTGNGSTLSVSGVGFSADLTWLKNRDTVRNHNLTDTVRGVNKYLSSDTTDDERTGAGVQSWTSDGFTLGSGAPSNDSGDGYVAWNWKAGGTAVSNTDGSITSSVSANTTAGFSIVSYTGQSAAGTVGHGLSQAPEMIILKNRDQVVFWAGYVEALGNTKSISINDSGASYTEKTWNDTSPTSTVFSIGAQSETSSGRFNVAGEDFIAYCFHSVDGYSKVGSWEGNSSADGAFIYTGFRPAYFLSKWTGGGDEWHIFDNKRDTYNYERRMLNADTTNAESSPATEPMDFVSNGVKIRTTYGQWNTTGRTYIYLAFAESPMKYSRGR